MTYYALCAAVSLFQTQVKCSLILDCQTNKLNNIPMKAVHLFSGKSNGNDHSNDGTITEIR